MSLDPLAAPQPLAPQAPAPRTQKQFSNVYTMMLIVSFAAMVTASVVLYLHLQEFTTPGSESPWWTVPAELKTQSAS